MKQNIITLTFILLSLFIFGQNKTPKISGTVKISVENGTLDCDITLSDYSQMSNYLIRLNKGLNILNIQSLEPNKFLLVYEREFSDSLQTDETISYYFPASEKGQKFLPSKMRFKYVGKFPVINDTISENYQRTDWRGNIAFKNGLLRMDGLQSAWFPTIYDVQNNFQFDILKYDLKIICEDCEQIYFNGSVPVNGKNAHFVSESPKEPYLFVGNYKIQDAKNITLLNADFTEQEVSEFNEINSKIIDFLSSYTNIPYKEKVYWIQAYNSSIEKGNFTFASNSTFTICGSIPPNHDLISYVNSAKLKLQSMVPHEISHYYFGNSKNCNNDLEVILNEGFAQFLAFKYLSQFEDEDYIKEGILESLDWFEEPNFKYKAVLEFNNSENTNDRQTYAYDYQTSILFSIEKEIGVEKMQNWIRLLLHGVEPISDKTFFKNTLKKATNNEKKFNEVVNKYLTGEMTVENMRLLWEN
ncbi:M1 family aminopeptidase [Flavobacterium sp.]|uniref:M1 family aminopeptidase n=3 Tax=Flavobacterium sp. TaxID=239 RepID=UPI0040473CE4